MVQPQSSNDSSVSLSQDSNLRQFLQRQASIELDEVHTKSISEWIKLAHEYLRDFEEALLREDLDTAYIKFLIASRISYNIIPVHPNHPEITFTEQKADDLLRKKILDNFAGFMRSTIPVLIARETAMLCGGSPNLRSTDRITPPASPALTTLTGHENDRRSILSSDSTSQYHTYTHDNISVHSESTTRPVSTSSLMTNQTPSISGVEQPPQPLSTFLPMYEPLMYSNEVSLTDAIQSLETLVINEPSQQTNTNDVIQQNNANDISSGPSTITEQPKNKPISKDTVPKWDLVADMVDEINQQLEEQNLKKFNQMQRRRRYTPDNEISSDEDEDYVTPMSSAVSSAMSSAASARSGSVSYSQRASTPRTYVPPAFPTVGFHNGNIPDDLVTSRNSNGSISRSLRYNGASNERSQEEPPMTPPQGVFPLDNSPDTLQRTNVTNEAHNNTPQGLDNYGVLADHNHLSVQRADSVANYVLSPAEPITLSLQSSSNEVYKPDEHDAYVEPMEGASHTQKPHTRQSTAPSIASSTSSKGTNTSSGSQHTASVPAAPTKTSKTLFGFINAKKTIKVDGNTNKVVTSTVPQPARRKESKTAFTVSSTHYKPFGSIVAKKSDVTKVTKHPSRTYLPPIPQSKPVETKTRNSISDDDEVSDSESQSHPFGASVPDGRDSLRDHRSSITSGSLRDHRSSFASSSSHEHRASIVSSTTQEHRSSNASNPVPIPNGDPSHNSTTIARSLSSHGGEGLYSTSPASISNSTRTAPSPRTAPVAYEQDRSTPTHRVGPTIERLRRHAQTNLEFIRYMTFPDLVSVATDMFVSMRKLELEQDYENAYIHGMQGMIIATYVIPKHVDCVASSGVPYFRYVELVEIINFRYKSMLANIQNVIENNDLHR
ncbi:hypothetical protein BGW37DRAFT_507990 [Umbelopsis sp. PMI_123]|nr:hypothetical protein BGW37DRAFT_507990 [Umbelopsis sp. PMI_123]